MNLHIRVLHNGLTTKMFSAECGSPLNSSRVASAKLSVYPYIIPGIAYIKLLISTYISMYMVKTKIILRNISLNTNFRS